MKKRALILSLSSVLLLGSLSACSAETTTASDPFAQLSKEEVIEMYNDLEVMFENQYEELSSTKQMLKGISEELPTSAIEVVGDGTGDITFNSIDANIIFNDQFQYPNSTQTQANGGISIVQGVTIQPNSSWVARMNGSALELQHLGSDGEVDITGTINIGNVEEDYDKTLLKDEVIAPWLEQISPSKVTYEDIFINGIMWGTQAKLPILIDEKDAYLRCGMAGFGGKSIVYVFTYRGEQDSNKEESILTLLNTMVINSNQVTIGK